MASASLSPRQLELITAMVEAWEASGGAPFDLPAGGGQFAHEAWPADVALPSREEIRSLNLAGLLTVDPDVAPSWRVFPNAVARRAFGDDQEAKVAEALADVDRRLGVILEATVRAFEADSSEPLRFAPMEQVEIVRHPHWPLPPDVVRSHDLRQLEDLGLIGTEARGRDTGFWPTSDGRAAVGNPAGLLERRAEQAVDESERSRLRQWAGKLRAGDIAVGTVAGTTGAVVRALIGL